MWPKRPTAGKVKPPILGMYHAHNVSLEGTMEDTQRSPTISTENQGITAKVAGDSGQSEAGPSGDVPPRNTGSDQCPQFDGWYSA